jgi:hypothetical protein
MKLSIVLATATLLPGSAGVDRVDPPGKQRGAEVAARGQKLPGVWQGGGCDGRLVLRADSTYALTDWGPTASEFTGTWLVRGHALPATLVLKCKSSLDPKDVGKTTELKIIKLDDKNLAVEYANPNGSPPGRYTRVPTPGPSR